MAAPSVHDVLLPYEFSLGARVRPELAIKRVVTGAGAEQRIQLWSAPRRIWDLQVEGLTYVQRQSLAVFHQARGANGFRFKAPESNTTGSTKYNLTELTATTFQLVIYETSGAQTVTSNIYFPVSGTVHIWDGATEITSGITINYLTGVVTFSSDPGYTPSWTGDYHLPVIFERAPQFSQDFPVNFNAEFTLIELTQ